MSQWSLSFEADALAFMSQDFFGTIINDFSNNKQEFGDMLVGLVLMNTPDRTGALRSSIKWEPDTQDNWGGLVTVFADNTEQLARWNRVYALYQEGGALGLATYTNAPHEMFAKAIAQVDTIMTLATSVAQRSADRLASGRGVPFG